MAEATVNQQDVDTAQPKRRHTEKTLRAVVSLFGVFLIAVGAALLKQGMVGLDPFTATNIGLAKILGVGLGASQLGFNLIIFLIVLFLDRSQIGLGTIFNMTFVGFGIQIFSQLYQDELGTSLYIPVLVIDAIAGLLIFTLGTSLYTEAHLGVAPYDALAPIICKKTHIKYQYVRSAQDISFMILGIVVHGDIGLMTIVIAFFAGPLINKWSVHVAQPIIRVIKRFSGDNQKVKHVGLGTINMAKLSLNTIGKWYMNTNEITNNAADMSKAKLEDIKNSAYHNAKVSNLAYNAFYHQYYVANEELKKKEQ